MNRPFPSRIWSPAAGRCVDQALAHKRKAGLADPGGLLTSSKFIPGCLMPLMITGTLNSSATLNSFISWPIASSAEVALEHVDATYWLKHVRIAPSSLDLVA